MKMNRTLLSSLQALAILAVPALPQNAKANSQDQTVWAQDKSDITPDANVTYGKLPNGMKYILMPNQDPPGRVSMRLHIAAGSLMEREDQRGVAHFLEHMVFNGSKHFPDSSQLIPKMQRLGIAFGAHANAYTSFDETVYMLDLPNNEEDTLQLGFDVMRDFGDGAFLRNEEIEKERGVILAEKTSRDSVQMRLMEQQFNSLLPDAKLAKRFPIGTEEIIKSAPRSAFTDFYEQFYVPERMTFIYVGDFDVKKAEQRIIKNFGSMKQPAKAGKSPDLGKVSKNHGFRTLVLGDKEVATTDITLLALKPFTAKPDTVTTRGEKLPFALANAIIDRRFSLLAKKEKATISKGGSFKESLFDFVEMGGLSVDAKNHQWQAALPVLEQEFRRAMEHGFTESELAEAKANLVNYYERQVKAAPSRKTPTLASSLAKHVHKNAVFSTPEDDLKILNANLEKITPETCHEAFKSFWSTQDVTLVLTTNTKPEKEDIEMLKLYEKSQNVAVKAPEKKASVSFGYTDFGPTGTIEKQTHVKDLDITQLHFHNGCRCNLKKTDFTKNSVSMTARVGPGKLTMPRDQSGLDMFASATLIAGGLGKHSSDDLRSILAGKNAGVSFSVTDDAFVLSGATTPDDLELQLQLLCAYLTDPGLRPEAERLFKAQLPKLYSQLKHTQAGAQQKIDAYLHGNDPRFVIPTEDKARKLSLDDVKQWVLPSLKQDPLELSIIGDFDQETLIPILSRTIGALPQRKVDKPAYDKERTLDKRPEPPTTKRYTFESRIPTGAAMVVWKGPGLGSGDIKATRRMGVLSSILSNRMREKIREELGEAYSPYSGFQSEAAYKDLGYLLAVSPGKPEQSERVGKIILEIGQKLASKGATEDELNRALTPKLSMLKKTLRENSYWLGTVMSQSQEQPYRLDWARQRDQDYASITLEEINALAKKYLSETNAYRFEIIPENPGQNPGQSPEKP
ncbi:insulinase family protein [Verrucomicrobiaceae bacterium N1E253]|uniref:Insulinase family protein n=1 Tax=Oceaniferula marina TaxID=2748318 RepID=A0A851GJ48_9BACT|nr:M16 family metallopeptidase [Oceaniferula marina]NWK57199.1 insulinase family protein [Oceaniferula marina]